MNRFLNRLPTITIREGHRVKVYVTSDLDLPAWTPATATGRFGRQEDRWSDGSRQASFCSRWSRRRAHAQLAVIDPRTLCKRS